MKNIITAAFVLSIMLSTLYTQHDHNSMDQHKMELDTNMAMDSTMNSDTNNTDHKHQHDMNEQKSKDDKHSMHNMEPGIPMTHAYSLSLPMNRNGSGQAGCRMNRQ